VFKQSTRWSVTAIAIIIVSSCGSTAYASHLAPGVPNFRQVSPTLMRGGQPSNAGLKALKNHGVRTVVDLRTTNKSIDKERKECEILGIRYINFPTDMKAPSKEKVESFLQIVCNPEHEPVYVHCRFGADRTGMMMAIYRVLIQNWSYDRAYTEMRQHHFFPLLTDMKKAVQQHAASVQPVHDTNASD
jgi:tyrosine-protein phosphatase SIW14